MDLGIGGRKALVCAASKGLGRGCAEALAQAGVDVTILARTRDDVRKTAEEIGERAGRSVAWITCDITTPEGRGQALAACPEPDILINNAGGPPPGDFRDFDRDAWIRANVQLRDDVELIDAALITSPRVWVASGHVEQFNDPLVQCLGECKNRYRADQIDSKTCPLSTRFAHRSRLPSRATT